MWFALYIPKNLLGISDEIISSASVASWPPYRLCTVVLCTIILEILSPDASVGFFNFHRSLLLSRFSEIHKYSNSSGTSPHIHQPIGTLKTQSLTPHSPKCISDFFPFHLIPHLFKNILPLSPILSMTMVNDSRWNLEEKSPPLWQNYEECDLWGRHVRWKTGNRITKDIGLSKCKADVRISISISLNRLIFPTKWRKSPSWIALSGWVCHSVIFEACHQGDFCICIRERIM